MGTLREKFDRLWMNRKDCAKQAPLSMPKRRSELDDADRVMYERYGVKV
jgi:hypothetical protein